jgi:hypothetical protein
MKPTQEQIEAALALIDTSIISADQVCELLDYAQSINTDFCHQESDCRTISAHVLAAAYRKLQEENNRLKPWADLAISSNALLAIEKSKNA